MEISTLILVGAALCGALAGFSARRVRFCTFGAIEDALLIGDSTRLRTWGVVIGVAMITTQTLWALGLIDLGTAFYLSPTFNPVALLVGSLAFGLGMAMVGNCAFGMFIRLGGGDLRAVFVFLVMGIVAYATARGLPALLRVGLFDGLSLSLADLGGQGLGQIVAKVIGSEAAITSLVIGSVVTAGLLFRCLRDGLSRRDLAAGFSVGLAVAIGFWLTGGLAQEGLAPIDLRSLTYVLPPGEFLVYLMTFTGATMTFPIAMVIGTLAGVWLASMVAGDGRFEGYDGGREMKRHFFGAILMGFGGVTALGCTIGQGVTGLATLSLGAPIAMIGIVVGAVAGIRILMTGSIREGLGSLLAR